MACVIYKLNIYCTGRVIEMTKKKTSEAQLKASRKREGKNRRKATIASYKRSARTFIRNHAEIDDLEELQQLIEERKQSLKDN